MFKKITSAVLCLLMAAGLGISASAAVPLKNSASKSMQPVTREILFAAPTDDLLRHGLLWVYSLESIVDGTSSMSQVRYSFGKNGVGFVVEPETKDSFGSFSDGVFDYTYYPDRQIFTKVRTAGSMYYADAVKNGIVSSGMMLLDGENRYFETYQSDGGAVIRVYFAADKSTIYAVEESYETEKYILRDMSCRLRADASLLQVPAGYELLPLPAPGVLMPVDLAAAAQ